jgi:hypothetical protein
MTITGLPPGLLADFLPNIDPDRLTAAIESQGARFAWTRAIECPCLSNNNQTRQADPNCPVCRGSSALFFGPTNYRMPDAVGELTPIQQNLINTTGAAVIRGLVSGVSKKEDYYDVFGHWYWGTVKMTVRPENKLGFFDKLVGLDSELVYYERLELAAGQTTIPTRYPVIQLNHAQSLTTTFREGVEVTNNLGQLSWRTASVPTTASVIAVHYTTYPVWRVIDYPHVYREAATRQGRNTTPLGTPRQLPIQAKMKLDFVPDGDMR